MFSIAARFASHRTPGASSFSPRDGAMWPAGDEFFDRARALLGRAYLSPRVATVQALLLMGYREIGIGAMAHAWLYVGMDYTHEKDAGTVLAAALPKSSQTGVMVGMRHGF